MNTHQEREAILKAILANPDDDFPRFVMADWLEENGRDERAQSIRRSLTGGLLAGLLEDFSHWEDSIASLTQHRGEKPWSHEMWCRGFLERINCPLDFWMDYGKVLVAHHPINKVHITNKKPFNHVSGDGSWAIAAGRTWKRVPGRVPDALREYLYALPNAFPIATHFIAFPTVTGALDALNAASLAWAKNQPTSGMASTKSDVPA